MKWYDLTIIKKLKYCYELILPTIYNESLSFEQKLNHILDILKKLIESNIELSEQMQGLEDWVKANLKGYAQEILNQYLQDGSLAIDTSYDSVTRTLVFKFTNLGLNPIIRYYSGMFYYDGTQMHLNQSGDLINNAILKNNQFVLTLNRNIDINSLNISCNSDIDVTIVREINEKTLTLTLFKNEVQMENDDLYLIDILFNLNEQKGVN